MTHKPKAKTDRWSLSQNVTFSIWASQKMFTVCAAQSTGRERREGMGGLIPPLPLGISTSSSVTAFHDNRDGSFFVCWRGMPQHNSSIMLEMWKIGNKWCSGVNRRRWLAKHIIDRALEHRLPVEPSSRNRSEPHWPKETKCKTPNFLSYEWTFQIELLMCENLNLRLINHQGPHRGRVDYRTYTDILSMTIQLG